MRSAQPVGIVEPGEVATVRDHVQFGVAQRLDQGLPDAHVPERVVRSPDHQGGVADRREQVAGRVSEASAPGAG